MRELCWAYLQPTVTPWHLADPFPFFLSDFVKRMPAWTDFREISKHGVTQLHANQ
jgi:hypothetical protein